MTYKTWFITGVSSGFGLALAKLALQRGDRVAGSSRQPDQVNDLKAEYDKQFWVTSLDLTDTASIRVAVEAAFGHFGHIDVIVNNAGYALIGAAEEVTDDQLLHQLNTNLLGSIQVIRAALPHLRTQGEGRIIQMSSIGGQIATPGLSVYHASKWGIEGFLESIITEVAPFGIQATIVEPGGGRTSIFNAGRLIKAPELDAYKGSPARLRKESLESGSYVPPGDPLKMMQAVIDSVDLVEAPRRLVLGSDAYQGIRAVLTQRLAALEAQKEVAFSTDAERS
jgi:NAD(P)-dependent dehydrogenase (short-subunit alcohol dehydrogenase family)